MRLLTHNLIACNRKQCPGGFPLEVKLDEKAEEQATSIDSSEFQPEFIRSMLPKLDWDAFVKTATKLGLELPPSYEEADLTDEHFLRAVHDAAVDFHILEAKLVCPLCTREYPVTKGIPNMLLQDDEV
ncbi:trm112p family domain-containing protein [Cystoisospora suis]|uniref:Trm112p family domain-containing protein n=1 Tax=Cystoisospora suis TaxID=483139 RepID=A0A2C6LA29_9APIC|nr:trm112p family domain-containing protein [Cystoisospora suis]